MTTHRRVQQQPAFILHHRPFRDTSQILDVISHDHGKLSLVARGSRGVRSRLKGILRPFMPLSVSWVIKSDLGTLTGAEVHGAPLSLYGDALLSGFYINELILHFLHRHDPQPEIFDAYVQTIQALAAAGDEVAPCLRQFEIELLRQVGYALNLDYEYGSQQALDKEQYYDYRVEQGHRRAAICPAGRSTSSESLVARCRRFSSRREGAQEPQGTAGNATIVGGPTGPKRFGPVGPPTASLHRWSCSG